MSFHSITDLAGEISDDTFAFSFPYLSEEHIHVYLDGEETEDFSFASAFVVELDTPLAAAATVRVQRLTPIDEPAVDFVNGAVLGESDLDSAGLQLLYAMQETADDQLNNLRLAENILDQFDALGNRIINVGAPVDADDATTKEYVDDMEASALSAVTAQQVTSVAAVVAQQVTSSAAVNLLVDDAEAAEAAAALSETAAAASETAAGLSEDAAALSASGAASSKTAADADAVAAAASAAAAAVSQSAAAASAAAAVISASGAATSKTGADSAAAAAVISAAAASASQTAAASSASAASSSASTASTQAGLAATAKTAAEAAQAAAEVAAGITGKVVRMVRTGVGTWVVYDSAGALVNIASSTTDGLQEAITTASTQGASLWVYGGSVTSVGADNAVISCTTGIVWPAMQGKTVRIDWCTIDLSAAVTGTGMFIDSCMMVDMRIDAQIVYRGNGACIAFNPTANVPLDAVKVIGDSKFEFGPLVTIGGTNPKGASWDADLGPIFGNTFYFKEINGADFSTVYGQHGLVLNSGASCDGIFSNVIKCPHVHKWSGSSVQVGHSTAGATQVHSNVIEVNVYPDGASSVAMQVYGVDNRITCSLLSNEGTIHTGIKLETSADKNVFNVMRNEAATTKINDLSTTKSNIGLAGSYAIRASVHKNGVDQTGIVTATFTKCAMGTEVFDHGAAYDAATNFRWTPGRLGVARINAHVGWVTIGDQSPLFIAIYKNGSLHRYQAITSSGTSGNQGAMISAMVLVDAVTDYFEIFARQDSGSNRDIEGDAESSWAMYEMLE